MRRKEREREYYNQQEMRNETEKQYVRDIMKTCVDCCDTESEIVCFITEEDRKKRN